MLDLDGKKFLIHVSTASVVIIISLHDDIVKTKKLAMKVDFESLAWVLFKPSRILQPELICEACCFSKKGKPIIEKWEIVPLF